MQLPIVSRSERLAQVYALTVARATVEGTYGAVSCVKKKLPLALLQLSAGGFL